MKTRGLGPCTKWAAMGLVAWTTTLSGCGTPGASASDDLTDSVSGATIASYRAADLLADAQAAALALGFSREEGNLAAAIIYWETGRLKVEAAPAAVPSNNVFKVGQSDCVERTSRADFATLDEATRKRIANLFANQTGCTAFGGISFGTLSQVRAAVQAPFPGGAPSQKNLAVVAAWQDPEGALRQSGAMAQKVAVVSIALHLCAFDVRSLRRVEYWNKGPSRPLEPGDLGYTNEVLGAAAELEKATGTSLNMNALTAQPSTQKCFR